MTGSAIQAVVICCLLCAAAQAGEETAGHTFARIQQEYDAQLQAAIRDKTISQVALKLKTQRDQQCRALLAAFQDRDVAHLSAEDCAALAQAAETIDDFAYGEKIARAAIQKAPAAETPYITLTRMLLNAGKVAAAETLVADAVVACGPTSRVHYLHDFLSERYQQRGDLPLAIAHLQSLFQFYASRIADSQEAISLATSRVERFLNLHESANRRDEAVQSLRSLMESSDRLYAAALAAAAPIEQTAARAGSYARLSLRIAAAIEDGSLEDRRQRWSRQLAAWLTAAPNSKLLQTEFQKTVSFEIRDLGSSRSSLSELLSLVIAALDQTEQELTPATQKLQTSLRTIRAAITQPQHPTP